RCGSRNPRRGQSAQLRTDRDRDVAGRVRAGLRPGRPRSVGADATGMPPDLVHRTVRVDQIDQRRRCGGDCDAHLDSPARRPGTGRGSRRRPLTTLAGERIGSTRMNRRLIVVGGDAAGMSAASVAKRRAGDDLEIVVFERGRWTSYCACGIPCGNGGEVDGLERVVARTPEQQRANGIDVRLHSEVTGNDPDARRVRVLADGEESSYDYDDLLIATGAEP